MKELKRNMTMGRWNQLLVLLEVKFHQQNTEILSAGTN